MKSIGAQIRRRVAVSNTDANLSAPMRCGPGVAKPILGSRILPGLSNRFQVEAVPLDELHSPSRQVRRHSERQLAKLGASISKFDFLVPVLATADGELITGTARVEAARRCGLNIIPVLRISHLGPDEIRAFRIADNRLVELGEWDEEQLAIELKGLSTLNLDFSLELTGFDTAEIDLRIASLSSTVLSDPADQHIAPPLKPVSRPGDLWLLGRHRLFCGNSLEASTYEALMSGELAQMITGDCPYNVKIDGHVGGLGKVHHADFAMASGEMSEDEFIRFLTAIFLINRRFLTNGGLAYYFMDWRHVHEITMAQRAAGFALINLCVWAKTNGGMGSLYRSRHELIFVMSEGSAPPVNNVQLGRFGRYRTNVWDYAGINSFGKDRDRDLASHPTKKPVALIADSILDVTRRGDIVLDPFCGSGTTIIAAERTGRCARAIEIDAGYVDVSISRWQELTGEEAVLVATGQSFSEVAAMRASPPDPELARQHGPSSVYRVRHRSRTTPVVTGQRGGGA